MIILLIIVGCILIFVLWRIFIFNDYIYICAIQEWITKIFKPAYANHWLNGTECIIIVNRILGHIIITAIATIFHQYIVESIFLHFSILNFLESFRQRNDLFKESRIHNSIKKVNYIFSHASPIFIVVKIFNM